MFDFEKLDVYQHVKAINIKVLELLTQKKKLDEYLKNEWKSANLKMVLNLVEGTGRISVHDKKQFLSASRGYVFEAVAILDALNGLNEFTEEEYEMLYNDYEKASKMLLGMYRSFDRSPKTSSN